MSEENNNQTEAKVQEEANRIVAEIKSDDINAIKAEFNTKLAEELSKSQQLVQEQVEKIRKELAEDYNKKVDELNKTVEEYSGRKGLISTPTENPLKQNVSVEPVVEEKKIDINNISRQDDFRLAEEFKKQLGL